MRKHILIIAPYVAFPDEPGSSRFVTLARLLSERFDTTLVTSRFCHFTKQQRSNIYDDEAFRTVLLNEPGYNKNLGLDRLKSHAQFCKNLKGCLAEPRAIDLVYCAFPLVRSCQMGADFCRARGIPFVVDIQDVWPDAIAGPVPALGTAPGRAILSPLRRRAQRVYQAVDGLVGVSETYLDYAGRIDLDRKRQVAAFLGSDYLAETWPNSRLLNDPPLAIYAGAFSGSYELETLIHAAAATDAVRIQIVGDGARRERLARLNKQLGEPVEMLPAVPPRELRQLLARADMALDPVRPTARQSVTNKLSEYFCAGLPIVSSQTNPEAVGLLEDGGNALYRATDVGSLVDQLQRLAADPERRRQINRQNLSIARQRFHRPTAYAPIVSLLSDLLGEP